MNNNSILSFTFLWYYSRSGSTHFCNNIHESYEMIYATPEINIFWLCKSFIAFSRYNNFSLGLRYLERSKLTLNFDSFKYQLFKNKMSVVNLFKISFSEYLIHLFFTFIQLNYGDKFKFHVMIKVSDINDFEAFFRSYKQFKIDATNNSTKHIISLSHLFLVRNPIFIHRSLISNNKFNYPFLSMGWRGKLFLISKLSSILRFCKKEDVQIIDFDDFCQSKSTLIIGNQEITYHSYKLSSHKQYTISNSELSIHTKATSSYQKPNNFQYQFSISNIFDKLTLLVIYLFIRLFSDLSCYKYQHMTHRLTLYFSLLLLISPLLLPSYLLIFSFSSFFQLIRDKHHAKIFHSILQ